MITDGPWKGRPQATSFNEREFQVCITARLIEDAKIYWVAAGGGPMYSVLLAKRLYAPDVVYVTEDGIIGAEPLLPLDPVMTIIGARPSYRAVMWSNMNGVGDHCSIGYMDYGILNTLQIDPYGNINSTWIGRYGEEGQHKNGPGGADTIASQCHRTIIMTDHQARKFVDRVDFISSPGYLDGSVGARERVGLPRGTGPWAVVTNWAVFDFDQATRQMCLRAIAPFVTLDQVLEEMSFKPLIADDIKILDPPTDEELEIFRVDMDVRGQFSSDSNWVTREGDSWTIT